MDIPFFKVENQSLSGSDLIATRPDVAIPYLTIISVVMVTGTCGNVLVICAVFLQKELHYVGNMFIVNLAIADLCVTAFVDPFSIVGLVNGAAWFESRPGLCELIACICLTSCFCSLLTIGAIAINRYIHICHYSIYNKVYTARNAFLMCAGLWVVSFLAEMPNLFGWGDHVFDKKNLMCVWDRTAALSYSVFFSVVGVALPVVLIGICYALIFKHFLDARPTMKLLQVASQILPAKETNFERQSKQMTIMVFTSFVVFTVCWTPYALIVALDYKDVYPLEAHLYAILIAHTNSSLNNIVYGICNETFRNAYFSLLGLHRCLPSLQNNKGYMNAGETSTAVKPSVSRI